MPFVRWLSELRRWDRLAGIGGIARRYFALNAFDGSVTILGVVVGSYSAGIDDPKVVLTTGISTSIAIGVSGLWGSYLTESAERSRDVGELETHMLRELGESDIGTASRAAVLVVTAVDAGTPFLSAGIALLPFLFAEALPSMDWAYGVSVGLALVSLLAVGAFLGHVSEGSKLGYAVKMGGAGVMALALGWLLG